MQTSGPHRNSMRDATLPSQEKQTRSARASRQALVAEACNCFAKGFRSKEMTRSRARYGGIFQRSSRPRCVFCKSQSRSEHLGSTDWRALAHLNGGVASRIHLASIIALVTDSWGRHEPTTCLGKLLPSVQVLVHFKHPSLSLASPSPQAHDPQSLTDGRSMSPTARSENSPTQ